MKKSKFMRKCKFKVGDKVRVVKYGHPFWSWDKMPGMKLIEKSKDKPYWYDMRPDIVGEEGTVADAHLTQGIPTYALNGTIIYAWYDEKQLELLSASKD